MRKFLPAPPVPVTPNVAARGPLWAVAIALGAASMIAGCGSPGAGTYCQSGPRYGTQCYAEPDVRQPPGAPRPIDPPGRPEAQPRPPGKRPW